MAETRIQRGGLKVAAQLDTLVAEQMLPGTGIDESVFWSGLEAAVNELGPVNRTLLAERDRLQKQIDAWHLARKGQVLDEAEYKAF